MINKSPNDNAKTNNSANNINNAGNEDRYARAHAASTGRYAASAGERFIALEVAYDLIRALRPIVPVIERHNHSLADQLFRAASSVAMNLAEGQRSQKGNQQKHYAIAHGSANEVKAALHVASAWGWLDESDRALAVMDRLLALLWRLTHRGPRTA